MNNLPYLPIFELTRSETVESIHAGAVAVVNVWGDLVAGYGDPEAVTFLRSTAKPFQVLPFLEHGGQAFYNLTLRQVALMCSSHSGTDEHVAVAQSIQTKIGLSEQDLLCGVHPPFDEATAEALRERREAPTPNRHNCSGKHTGMLAYARMRELSTGDYINPHHPIQKEILHTFAEMCELSTDQVAVGVDGCSAPNFAVPLRSAALALARLCDPLAGNVHPAERIAACRTVTSAMMLNPDMISGRGEFDTQLMEIGQGRIISKGGAEGFQGIGLMAGALGSDSPAIGIALKIADGDARKKVRHAVAVEVLRQLGALTPVELDQLAGFGPSFPVLNWRKIRVGQGYPCFQLNWKNGTR